MKALRWYGKKDVRVKTVAEPKLVNSHDAIIKINATAQILALLKFPPVSQMKK